MLTSSFINAFVFNCFSLDGCNETTTRKRAFLSFKMNGSTTLVLRNRHIFCSIKPLPMLRLHCNLRLLTSDRMQSTPLIITVPKDIRRTVLIPRHRRFHRKRLLYPTGSANPWSRLQTRTRLTSLQRNRRNHVDH